MISWCSTCQTTPVEIPEGNITESWCAYCWHLPELGPYNSAMYTMKEYFAGYERLWASRTPRIEYNTVDLAELRRERDSRRYIDALDWWDRYIDRLLRI